MARISKAVLIKLQKTLKTDEAIGDKYKITRQAVHLLRRKYGIKAIPDRFVKRNKKILALSKKGITGYDIAKKVGLSFYHVYRLLSNMRYSR